jgi:hypothetical protein
MAVNDVDATARRAEQVTIERWEYDNPSWVVVDHHPVITTALDGKPVEETVVEVEHRQTGERVSGVGTDLTLALALVTHRLSERA